MIDPFDVMIYSEFNEKGGNSLHSGRRFLGRGFRGLGGNEDGSS
jgi:hypothetical protein